VVRKTRLYNRAEKVNVKHWPFAGFRGYIIRWRGRRDVAMT